MDEDTKVEAFSSLEGSDDVTTFSVDLLESTPLPKLTVLKGNAPAGIGDDQRDMLSELSDDDFVELDDEVGRTAGVRGPAAERPGAAESIGRAETPLSLPDSCSIPDVEDAASDYQVDFTNADAQEPEAVLERREDATTQEDSGTYPTGQGDNAEGCIKPELEVLVGDGDNDPPSFDGTESGSKERNCAVM